MMQTDKVISKDHFLYFSSVEDAELCRSLYMSNSDSEDQTGMNIMSSDFLAIELLDKISIKLAMNKTRKLQIWYFAGSIGAGKTTLINAVSSLMKETDLSVEVVHEIDGTEGELFVKAMYTQDMAEATFQTYMATSMFQRLDRAIRKRPDVILVDRCAGEHQLFAEWRLNRGAITNQDCLGLEKTRKAVEEIFFSHYDKSVLENVICLNMTTETLEDRILQRARPGEENISHNDLEELNSMYRQLFSHSSIIQTKLLRGNLESVILEVTESGRIVEL